MEEIRLSFINPIPSDYVCFVRDRQPFKTLYLQNRILKPAYSIVFKIPAFREEGGGDIANVKMSKLSVKEKTGKRSSSGVRFPGGSLRESNNMHFENVGCSALENRANDIFMCF